MLNNVISRRLLATGITWTRRAGADAGVAAALRNMSVDHELHCEH
jgi:hypothetical protein